MLLACLGWTPIRHPLCFWTYFRSWKLTKDKGLIVLE